MPSFGKGWGELFRSAKDAIASKMRGVTEEAERVYRRRFLDQGGKTKTRNFHAAPPPLPPDLHVPGAPPIWNPNLEWNPATNQLQKAALDLEESDQNALPQAIDRAINVANEQILSKDVSDDIKLIASRTITALEEWKKAVSAQGDEPHQKEKKDHPSQQGPPEPPKRKPPKGPSDYNWPEQPKQGTESEYDWPTESYIDISEDEESVRRTGGSSNVYSYVWFSNDYTVMDEGYVARRPRVASKKAEKNGTLIVTFKAWEPGMKQSERPDTPGATYAYSNVSEVKYNLFNSMAESSAGEAVWDYLRLRGTLTGHQHSYRLISVSGEYVPRKATARGFRSREMVMPPKFSSPITATKPSTLPPGPLTRFGRPISPEEALSPRQARAYARRGGYPNRGEPNRGQP